MTVSQLMNFLEDCGDDNHVVITLLPKATLMVQLTGEKLELAAVKVDAHGVVNLIAGVGAGEVDPKLREGNP